MNNHRKNLRKMGKMGRKSTLLAGIEILESRLLLTGTATPIITPSVFGRIVSDDFNGDGKADLVVGTQVLLSKGDGTFTKAGVLADLSSELADPVTGDFNHDGKPDVAALVPDTGGQEKFEFFFGNGDGTFKAPLSVPLGIKANPNSALAATDLNHDLRDDVAVVSSSSVNVLLSNGDGTFRGPINTVVSSNPNFSVSQVAVADFNNDTFPDLALPQGVLLANGNGTFKPMSAFGVAGSFNGPIAAARLTADKNIDLVVANGAIVQTLIGKGNGTFTLGPALFTVNAIPKQFALADFNHSTVYSLFVRADVQNSNELFIVYTGNGNGSFDTNTALTLPSTFASNAHIAFGDVNADGLLDFAAAGDANSSLSVVLNSAILPSPTGTITFGGSSASQNVVQTQHLSDGTAITYKITGPGAATISAQPFTSNYDVRLDGTTSATAFYINHTASSTHQLSLITINGSLNLIDGRAASVDTLVINGNVNQVSMGTVRVVNVTGSVTQITATSAKPVSVSVGSSNYLTLGLPVHSFFSSAGPLIVLTMASWNGTITAPSIGALLCRGDFLGTLDLLGTPGQATALGDFEVGGSVFAAAAATPGSYEKWLIAGDIGSFRIYRNVNNLTLDAGANLATGTYAPADITSILIGGTVTSSRIEAGVDANNQILPGGVIGQLYVAGPASANSKFLAASLPTTVSINGVSVTTAADARFKV